MQIKVKAVGHGLGYNRYPVEFEFSMNGSRDDWGDEDQLNEEVNERAMRKAKDKTACNAVTIERLEIVD